ncbi:MAG: OmpA family protein [Salinivirgaceae bacterium]|nr:OmpA family protein [Salinivirgaceae bacterium]
MRNIYILEVVILFLFLTKIAIGQDIPFTKQIFGNDKASLKDALKAIKDGDYYGSNEQFYLALDSYNVAQDINPNNSELNYKIGRIYLEIQRYSALPYIKKAHELNPGVAPDILFLLGLSNQYNQKFTEALEIYEKYRKQLLPSDRDQIDAVAKRILECKNGVELLKNPARAFITNVKELNSPYSDHSPVISTDESVMLFTSTREGSVGGRANSYDQEYDEDIYISYKTRGRWGAPVNVGDPLNTRSEDATVALSADGQSLLIYNGQRGNGDLQISRLDGDRWSWPEWLSGEINTKAKESSASFANNDRMIYFVSEMPGGIGGKDIWVSSKDRKGRWSQPKNLGTTINTPFDEESVFMHPDGRTLYFSSKGHNTMGGFDIFQAVLNDDGTWSKPENLGYPINTADDDLSFVISASGRNGYLSSKREGGMGRHDIYMVTFLGPEKPMVLSNEDNLLATLKQTITDNAMEKTVELKTIRLTVVKGVISDAISGAPIVAEIEVIDNEKDEVVFSNKSNSKTGQFLISLPSGKNYGLAVKAEGYLFHSENFNIPGATAYQEIEKEIKLNNIKKDVKIVLRNVFFDPGKAILRVESYPELNRLAGVMNEVPSLKIEISGHTDNTGSAAVNERLSRDRAKAVVDYLAAQQIASDRLTYEGFGYSQPIADNKTNDGRQQNRRVEFKVVSE